jgi:hypothetical protein
MNKHKSTKTRKGFTKTKAFLVGMALAPALVAGFLIGPGQGVTSDIVALAGLGSESDSGTKTVFNEVVEKTGEQLWKENPNVSTPPLSEDAKIKPFIDDMTANEWLHSLDNVDPEVQVVVTDNPMYNCGSSWVPEEKPDVFAVDACYSRDYGKTIFMYWGKQAKEDVKKLMLLKQYARFYQNFYYYSTIVSAEKAAKPTADGKPATISDEAFRQILSTDSTCRVYSWGFEYLREQEKRINNPCGDTAWDMNYLETQIAALGVVSTQQ